MIRLVSLGSQVNDGAREFAFVDTVTMRFVDLGGVQVFEDRADLEAAMQAAGTAPALRTRLLDLLPAEPAAERVDRPAGPLLTWEPRHQRAWEEMTFDDAPAVDPVGPIHDKPTADLVHALRERAADSARRHVTLRFVIEQLPDALRAWLAWKTGTGPQVETPIVTVTLPDLGVDRMPVRPQRWEMVDDGTIEVVFREVRDGD